MEKHRLTLRYASHSELLALAILRYLSRSRFLASEIFQALIVDKELNMKVVTKFAVSLIASLALVPVSTLAGHHEGGDHAVAAE